MFKNQQKNLGFTIVELLVVIVVIGILASITIVSYVGISQQATAANIKADISQAASKVAIFYADNGIYPTAIDDCPNTDSQKICVNPNPVNQYSYSSFSPYSTFVLDVSNGTTKYRVDNTSSIPKLAPTTTLITSIGAITGTTQTGSVLTAGSVSPAGSTVTYQWQSAASSDGTYSDISGATSNSYTLVPGDATKYLKVTVTGTGNYSGSVTSGSMGPITPGSVSVTVNGTAFLGNNPWTGTPSWGAEYDGDLWDNYSLELTSTFNLAAYSNGTISNVTLAWNYSGTGGTSGVQKYIRQGVTPFTTLYTTAAENYISSYSGSNLTTYVGSRKGTTCQIDWKSDYGNADYDRWGVQNNMSAPRLTFTWTPS